MLNCQLFDMFTVDPIISKWILEYISEAIMFYRKIVYKLNWF